LNIHDHVIFITEFVIQASDVSIVDSVTYFQAPHIYTALNKSVSAGGIFRTATLFLLWKRDLVEKRWLILLLN